MGIIKYVDFQGQRVYLEKETSDAKIHRVQTYFVEYRNWSQEVNTIHVEFAEPGKRFEAKGRHTPYDLPNSLCTFGDTVEEAIQKFRDELVNAPYDRHYKSINDELLSLRATIEQLRAQTPVKAEGVKSERGEMASGCGMGGTV